jgi:hypothetical protein
MSFQVGNDAKAIAASNLVKAFFSVHAGDFGSDGESTMRAIASCYAEALRIVDAESTNSSYHE